MLINSKIGEENVIFEDTEKEIFMKGGKILDEIIMDKEKLELIDYILDKTLYIGAIRPNHQLLEYLNDRLDKILGKEASAIFINSLRSLDKSKIILEEAERLNLLNKNVSKYLYISSIKYGKIYNIFLMNITRPTYWNRIESNSVITEMVNKGTTEVTGLSSKLYRNDGKIFEFDIVIRDGITLSEHFLRKTIEIINMNRKQAIYTNIETINFLEKEVSELKEIYNSVYKDIVEKSEG